ncbi:hypothetical protein [Roseomonas sp. BN140053]|uniref:hypothetical protein n=1 Tax=Roseomonas sp. BN140053 TaxID=3391898 RepID=UPI0039E75752
MSSFRAFAIAGRVVLIHDTPDHTTIAELDIEQADLLLQQMQGAVGTVLRQLSQPAAERVAVPDLWRSTATA